MDLKARESGHKGRVAAVIVEPRKHRFLYRVIKHFMVHLDDGIPFFLFYGKGNFKFVYDYFYREIHRKKLTLIELPVNNLTPDRYNHLLKEKFFYKHILYDKLLIFQTDAWLNTKSKRSLEDFLDFDYIGGYSIGITGVHGNGGLSLRDRLKSLRAITLFKKTKPSHYPEDLFFNYTIKKIKGKIACQKYIQQVHQFCCNYSYCDAEKHSSLFIHKVLPNQRYGNKITQYCPEAAGLVSNKIKLSQIIIPRPIETDIDEAKKKYSLSIL